MRNNTHDKPDDTTPVDVRLRLTAPARRALRVAADARGCSMSELVEHWATAEGDALRFTVAHDVGASRDDDEGGGR